MGKKDELKHKLIPVHTKLSEKDKKEFLEQYKVDPTEIPKIFESDPALRHMDVKPGDIIKIERKSPTAGKTVFYRGVISD